MGGQFDASPKPMSFSEQNVDFTGPTILSPMPVFVWLHSLTWMNQHKHTLINALCEQALFFLTHFLDHVFDMYFSCQSSVHA